MLTIKNVVFLSLWTLFLSLISYSTGMAGPNTQNELTWDRIEVMGALTNIPEIKYDANVEARDNIGEHRYELTRLEGDLGYQFLHNLSIWGGYNLLAIQQSPENVEFRLWQQLLWDIARNKIIHLSARTRVEDRYLFGQEPWGFRLRERLTFKFPRKIANTYTPVFWEELFFNLNDPAWLPPSGTFEQNRAFVGIDIPTGEHTFLEVGYLNRYRFRMPSNINDNVLYIIFYMKA